MESMIVCAILGAHYEIVGIPAFERVLDDVPDDISRYSPEVGR